MGLSSFSSYRTAQNVEDQDYDPDCDWYQGNPPGWDNNDPSFDPPDDSLIDATEKDEIEQKYQQDMWLQEQEDERLCGDYNSDFESDNEPDWYALGYDASKSGHSQIPPSSIFDAGYSAITLWNDGYRQSIEDRMENIGVKKSGKGGTK